MTPTPTVSVVIPIRNEAKFIERCLAAVLQQDYPPDRVQVLVADGMSDDATVSIIETMPGAERVQVIPNPERIQAHGLNLLIEQATGDIIVRVDGHTIIAPDYITRCVETLQATGADNVGGRMTPRGVSPFGQAIATAGQSPFGVPTAFHVSTTPQYTDTVYLGAWPRGVFERVGGFNVEMVTNQDYEHNYRIRQAGGSIYLNPAIQSTYYCRDSLKSLARQYFRYGQGKVKTLRQHPGSFRVRHGVAPAFVVGLAGGGVLGVWSAWLRRLWAGALGLYVLLSLIFAWRAVQAQPLPEKPAPWRVMVVFLVMHVAWGSGFWWGLFRRQTAP